MTDNHSWIGSRVCLLLALIRFFRFALICRILLAGTVRSVISRRIVRGTDLSWLLCRCVVYIRIRLLFLLINSVDPTLNFTGNFLDVALYVINNSAVTAKKSRGPAISSSRGDIAFSNYTCKAVI